MNMPTSALELFSGIGAFACAAGRAGIEIKGAFDQNTEANRVYELNFKHSPLSANLDTVKAEQLPEAELWWLSPPCQPYSRRGARRDHTDARARSLLNLIELLPQCRPQAILVENVGTFPGSRVHEILTGTLKELSYSVETLSLCSTDFGVPMQRPRSFVIALRDCPILVETPQPQAQHPLSSYLCAPPCRSGYESQLQMSAAELARYEAVLNIVDTRNDASRLICFTKGYWQCRKAAGSLLREPDGSVRRVCPQEMLRLFDFDPGFAFPPEFDYRLRWRLLGNSVDIRCIEHLLRIVARSRSAAL